jgi:hypothetical protein
MQHALYAAIEKCLQNFAHKVPRQKITQGTQSAAEMMPKKVTKKQVLFW